MNCLLALLSMLIKDKNYQIPSIKLNCGLLTFDKDQQVYFCNVASTGLSGLILQSMAHRSSLVSSLKKSLLKSFIYLLWTLSILFFTSDWTNCVLLNTTGRFRTTSLFTSISIGKCFGGGLCVSTTTSPKSFNSVKFQTISSNSWIKMILIPLFIITLPICILLKCFNICIPLHLICAQHSISHQLVISSSVPNIPVECDGELAGMLPVTVKILPKAIPWLFL